MGFVKLFNKNKSYTLSAEVVSKGLQIGRQTTNFQQQTCSTKYRTRYCSINNVKNVRKC